jgi:diguanylate cyclase (GGDEF)-like protein
LPDKINSNNQISESAQQSHVVSIFSLVGMSITGAMGLIGLYNNNFVLAATLFFASSIYFLGYFTYKKFNNIGLSSSIVLYSLYVLMSFLTYTGGVDNTGPLWIFMIAPVSLFLHGLKRGLIDIAIFVIIISIIMFTPTDIIAHPPYTTEFKLRLLYSFLTITFLSALYEYSRDKSYKHALELSDKYQHLANYDPLTQLSNRRQMLTILKREQGRAIRNKEPFSIIICDVDHFKKVNDQYGHNVGDNVLVELAKIFTDNLREQDLVARWGGEEFLFILPQTLPINANIVAEKIQTILRSHLIVHQGSPIKVTLSMGIEQFDGNCSIDDVINSADKYLYQAKNLGRNQIQPKF